MSQTALQLVNKVLRRLRIPQVNSTTFSETYPQLILDFVNESKREVEDAHNWGSLRQNKTVSVVASTSTYTLTGWGQRFRLIDERGFFTNSKTQVIPQPFDSFIEEQIPIANQIPFYYRIHGSDSNGDPTLEVWPTPNSNDTLTFRVVIPEGDMSAYSDTMKVVDAPVVMGAWAKAISERGEDGGQNTIEQYNMYQMALSDAIARDVALRTEETTWGVV